MAVEFLTNYSAILESVDKIHPFDYAKTRNFIDGKVTRLSPYISRGVISTKMLLQRLIDKGIDPLQVQKFVQELAWRDYWQLIWKEKGDAINKDLKHPQAGAEHEGVPMALLNSTTGIEALDKALKEFYHTGYLHNHVRMYLASIACNIAKCHWKNPAQWMYYHLLDADWASNALSWQWVAGSNSHKKYVANQDNINKYCYTKQKGTYLDIPYSDFDRISIPKELEEIDTTKFTTSLPEKKPLTLKSELPTLLYNFYNLDPEWNKDLEANKILLLEPSVFSLYPVSKNTIDFILQLAQNISGIQVFTGEFHELKREYKLVDFHYKEHPLNNYEGTETPRDWMFNTKGYYPSFFAYWKKCEKELKAKDHAF